MTFRDLLNEKKEIVYMYNTTTSEGKTAMQKDIKILEKNKIRFYQSTEDGSGWLYITGKKQDITKLLGDENFQGEK